MKYLIALALTVLPTLSMAFTATFQATKDTTIYNSGNVNGTGQAIFAGQNGLGTTQRGMLAFDLGFIPPGSTITNVTLSFYVTSQAQLGGAETMNLHRMTADWNEASVGVGGQSAGGGEGLPPSAGDATWTSSGIAPWASAGGDFDATVSSSAVVGSLGPFAFTGAGLVTDVQNWVDGVNTNYGWMIRGNEASPGSAKRLASRENTGGSGNNVPVLTVEFTSSDLPPQLPAVSFPPENPFSEEKRILGKILFWDEQLSSNNTVACGTCHVPSAGGTDPRDAVNPGPDLTFGTADDIIGSLGIVALSDPNTPINDPVFGFEPQVTGRASQSAIGVMFSDHQFWDGRAGTQFIDPEDGVTVVIASGGSLESQAVVPIVSSVEMGHVGRTWNEVRTKLQSVSPMALASTNVPADVAAAITGGVSYQDLFNDAFGDTNITAARIGMAIATYERTLLPDQSPWDLYVAGDTSAMNASQVEGWNILNNTGGGQRCLACHTPPLFTDNDFHNIGLRPSAEDLGRETVTSNMSDRGSFKTPSLRNSGLRSHMMHVGWITDNLDAIDFYNAGTADVTSTHVQFAADQSTIPGSGDPYSDANLQPENEPNQAFVAEFLSTALTDPRVAAETFPFDRPTLRSEFSPVTTGDQIKLMTYNLKSSVWNSAKADLVEDIIDVEDADVIGLQQAGATQVADLLARVGDTYDFVATTGSGNNNPILLRKGVFNVLTSGSTTENEVADCNTANAYVNHVVLEQISSGGVFSYYNTELCETSESTAQSQANTLMGKANANIPTYGPTSVAVGAYYQTVGSSVMNFLLEQIDMPGPVSNPLVFDDTYQVANMASNPGTDFIIYQPGVGSVAHAEVVTNPTTLSVAGTLPVVAIVVVDPPVDTDGDGLSDLAEAALGTDPNLPDTDFDGLTDFEEVSQDGIASNYTPGVDTDPLDADTDNDGLLDGEEDLNGNGIFEAGEPSPFLVDSDDDGLTDRYEVETSMTDPVTPSVIDPGDINGDGLINLGDLLLLNKQVLQ